MAITPKKPTASKSAAAPGKAPESTTVSASADATSGNNAAGAKAETGPTPSVVATATANVTSSSNWLGVILGAVVLTALVLVAGLGFYYMSKNDLPIFGDNMQTTPGPSIVSPALATAGPALHASNAFNLNLDNLFTGRAEARAEQVFYNPEDQPADEISFVVLTSRTGVVILTAAPSGGSRGPRLMSQPAVLEEGQQFGQVIMTLPLDQLVEQGMSLCFEWPRPGGVDGTCNVINSEQINALKNGEGERVLYFYF